MSAQPDTAYQFNFKIGGGNDSDLHNIYATNGADAVEQLEFFEETLLPRLIALHQTARAGGVVAATVPLAPAATQTVTAPPPAATPEAGGPLCEHGQPMKKIPAGISKASGKPYPAFYACNQPRGQQCNARVSV